MTARDEVDRRCGAEMTKVRGRIDAINRELHFGIAYFENAPYERLKLVTERQGLEAKLHRLALEKNTHGNAREEWTPSSRSIFWGANG